MIMARMKVEQQMSNTNGFLYTFIYLYKIICIIFINACVYIIFYTDA